MNLTQLEKSQIRGLVQSPQWKTVERVAKEFMDSVAFANKVRESEWETLKSVLEDEGQLKGVSRLLQELNKIAQQQDA